MGMERAGPRGSESGHQRHKLPVLRYWWPPRAPAVDRRCCWGQCSLEEVGGEMLSGRDLESSNLAGEGREKRRAAAFIPQVSVSWFREGKVINFSCLWFAAPRKMLPKKKWFQPWS